MFGWEFPPFSYGGLGTACRGIVEGLSHHDVHLTLVLPKANNIRTEKLHISGADDLLNGTSKKIINKLRLIHIDSKLNPYMTAEAYLEQLNPHHLNNLSSLIRTNSPHQTPYGKNLFEEISRYAQKAAIISKNHEHDIIHIHDWLTMPAGVMAKKTSGKPLISHIHATEFDRTGDNPHQEVYDIERKGMEASDHIIAVSEFTKQKIIQNYGISPDKITVVHNAVLKEKEYFKLQPQIENQDPVILFLGRMTLQKGPEYFLHMAKQVLEKEPKAKFVMAGDGDMMHRMIELSTELRIAKNVLFAGYLSGPEIDKAYANADLYIMPSVSEPFGITPLEAIKNGTPVMISRQSGVSEVIRNALRVDFWDIEEMANKTLAVIHYKKLREFLIQESQKDLDQLSWKNQAGLIRGVYHHVQKNSLQAIS
ncbi:MAG: glycosyltransferase [bacterium]|nr:glycosyltransferase [bacterium]